MRTFLFLCCTTMFGFTSNNVLSQNVNIKIDANKSISVDKVFDLIMKQTEYTFIYQVDLFKNYPEVKLEKGSIKLNKLLEKSLVNKNFVFEFTKTNTILIKEQQSMVSGVVTDTDGIPVPGLSVYTTEDAKGGATDIIRGTNTDFDGKYTIKAEVGEYLVITGVGFKKSITKIVADKSTYNVVLANSLNQLDEIVVVSGYQKISKERATGSYATISKKTIENNVNQSIGSVLQGVSPSIQVVEDADGKININNVVVRGVGSMNSSTTPLVVVDGFPISGGFETINPNDVESVTILKDAAAASIWGARAGNGVIVVVTKKATQGKMQVGISSFITIRDKMDLEYNLPRANSETTLAFESTLYQPNGHGFGYFMQNRAAPQTLADRSGVYGRSFSHGSRAYYDAYNGNITQAELNTTIERLKGINSYDDMDLLIRNPIQKQYNAFFANSTEKSNTRVSVLFNDNTNAFIGNNDQKILLNFNNQYKIKDWITLDFNGMLDNSKTSRSNIDFNTISNIAPYERFLNEDGSYASVRDPNYDPKYLEYFGNTMTNLPYDDITYNPLRDSKDTEFNSTLTNYRFNAGLSIKLLDGLKVRPSFQYEKFQTKNDSYYGPETSYVKYQVLNSTDIADYDPINATIGTPRIPVGAIKDNSLSETVRSTFRTLLTYDKTFNNHSFSALAGFERIASTNKFTGGVRTYGFNKDDNTFDNIPDRSPWIPIWNGGGIADGRFFSQSDTRFMSYFGNISYTYNNKYTFTGSARSDGANFIVEDASQRYNPMWSLGLLWNAKKESFLKDVDFVNRLTFRVTNGESGNLVGSEATKPTIGLSNSPNFYTGVFTASLNGLGNPDLRWERINTLNFGADFSLFDRKLYGSIDVYNKHSKLLIASVDTPATIGVTSARYNVGEMVNNGVELNLSSDLKLSENLNLTSNVVFSHNKSETTSLSILNFFPRGLENVSYIEGLPFRPVYAYEYGGMKTVPGQTAQVPTINGQNGIVYGMDENIGSGGEDGRDVLKYMGTAVAPTVVGWNNTFNYKGFTLSARIIGKFGHKFRRQTYTHDAVRLGGNYHKDLEGLMAGNHDAMGLPEVNTDYYFYSYRTQWYIDALDTLVEDAAHIRLRQVYLGYDVSNNIASKIGVSKLRLFAQLENLGNIWEANDHGIDPEYNSGVVRAPEETFTLGLNIEF